MAQLLSLFRDPAMLGRWPPMGSDLTIDNIEARMWNVGELQYAVLRTTSSELVGLVNAHGIDERNGTAALGFMIHPRVWLSGWPFEAVVLFLNLLFEWHGFRKIYCEMSGSTLAAFGGAVGRWLQLEATFHSQIDDRADDHDDWHVLSLVRDDWDPAIVGLVTGMNGGPPVPS
jgi:hypothetical protein